MPVVIVPSLDNSQRIPAGDVLAGDLIVKGDAFEPVESVGRSNSADGPVAGIVLASGVLLSIPVMSAVYVKI